MVIEESGGGKRYIADGRLGHTHQPAQTIAESVTGVRSAGQDQE